MTNMGADPSLDTFLTTLRRSRLLESGDLDRLIGRLRPTSAAQFAEALIRSSDLTHYQAEKVLQGRWQGLVLGPYSILAPLGRGGMGTVVYLARDRRMAEALGDSVLLALKLLPVRKGAHDPKVLARFRREMALGRRVNHPNVVRTFAAGDLDEVHYLALEFVPGKTVRQVVGQNGLLPFGEAARIFADVAAGLAHVHERGLVHRDVKPGNVMVRPDGRAVLLDLGLALAPGEPLPDDPAIAGGRGYVVGTMDYLAPEQARDAAHVGPAADLYGLGCALFYALTGTPPFPADGVRLKIERHRRDPLPGVANVPPEFARLVRWLMAKTPDKRPASAAQVRDLLRPWATPAKARGSIDALAAADAPGLDAGLWDATPGEDLPLEMEAEESNPLVRLENGDASASAPTPPAEERAPRTGWVLVALLVGAMALMMCVALVRRL
jgi:serine/threonine protein kinase